MSPEIVIIRDGEAYRVLHGHLRLATVLSLRSEVYVDVKDEGKIRIVKTRNGYFAGKDGQRLPLLRH